jgi:hypothetical protein
MTDKVPHEERSQAQELTCGLIMPISTIDGCTADHWVEVKSIINEAVESIASPRFVTRLVSDADEIGVIQKRIVQNVYNSSIVVCDVSGKNPNVMFELGLRLAFDKPTVIIKDDKTDYSFDTGVIEHVSYPRDLRFSRIVDFKKRLADKILYTFKASIDDPKHSPFLRSFGQFHVASLTQSEVSPDRVILEMLSDIQRELALMRRKERESRSNQITALPKELLRDVIERSVIEFCSSNKIAPEDLQLFTSDDVILEIAKRTSRHLSIPLESISRRDIESVIDTVKSISK